MGTEYYYCPHCSKGIPLEDIRKALKGEFDLQYKKLKDKEEQLEKELSNWERQFKSFLENREPTNYYDIIICIDSILGIQSGWKVKSSKSGKQLYNKMKNSQLLKVGIIGLRNKGKSFLLQKFLNKDLPKGKSVKTEGLSIKYPTIEDLRNQRNYILLDSVGFDEPLLDYEKSLKKLDKEEALNQLNLFANDKMLTELFLQNFIISASDILILVVGAITYTEQKLLNRITKVLKVLKNNRKIFKKLFVIHNLENFVEKAQVESYINDYLKNSATFELEEIKYINSGVYKSDSNEQYDKYYIETFDNDEKTPLQVFHLLMANDFSDAGEYYNKFAINYLKEHLNSFTNVKSFPAIEMLKDFFINFSYDAFENPIKESEVIIADDLTIKLNSEKKILFKNCFNDEIGFSNFLGSGFEPTYWIYKDKEKINITFESSGKVKEIEPYCEYGNGYIKFSISGVKEIKKPEENENIKFFQNSIKQGKFNFQIKLPFTNDIRLENRDEPDFEKGTTENGTGGLYTFSYKLFNKEYG